MRETETETDRDRDRDRGREVCVCVVPVRGCACPAPTRTRLLACLLLAMSWPLTCSMQNRVLVSQLTVCLLLLMSLHELRAQ